MFASKTLAALAAHVFLHELDLCRSAHRSSCRRCTRAPDAPPPAHPAPTAAARDTGQCREPREPRGRPRAAPRSYRSPAPAAAAWSAPNPAAETTRPRSPALLCCGTIRNPASKCPTTKCNGVCPQFSALRKWGLTASPAPLPPSAFPLRKQLPEPLDLRFRLANDKYLLARTYFFQLVANL